MQLDLVKGVQGAATVSTFYKLDGKSFKLNSDKVTVKVEWKKLSTIEIDYFLQYDLFKMETGAAGGPDPRFGNGGAGYSARWNVSFTEDGLELEQDGAQPRVMTKVKQDGQIVVSIDAKLAESKPGTKKPFVQIVIQGTVEYDYEGLSISGGLGPASIGQNVGAAKQKATSEETHTIYLEVVGRPVDPAKVPPKIRKEDIVVGSFAFGDATIKKIKPIGTMFDYSKLSAWYNKLPQATRDKILNGEAPGGKKILVTGYTDNVGDEHQNFDLGRKRALAVAEALEKISGVAWEKFVATPSKGEQDVRQENKNLEKKEDKHRRVEVEVNVEE